MFQKNESLWHLPQAAPVDEAGADFGTSPIAMDEQFRAPQPADFLRIHGYELYNPVRLIYNPAPYNSCPPSNRMLRLSHRRLEIRIDDDPSFTFGSVDNPNSYDHEYRLDDEPYTPTSLHTVSVTQEDGGATATCILGASGGASGVHEHSAIIHSNSLLIAVGPFVASLQLPALTLNWKVKTDWATCFGVYHSPENHCYISHGEIDVAAVSYDGVLIWSKSGADIFTNGFSLTQNHVIAIDWNEDRYVWDIATGALIESTAK